MTWAIKDWDKRFTCRQGKVVEDPRWVPVPNRHESEKYKLLVRSSEGVGVFGVFIALVQVASRCPTRGVLKDERGDLTPDRLQVKTSIPSRIIARAMARLASPEVGWLVDEKCHSSDTRVSVECQPSAPPPRARDRPEPDQRRPEKNQTRAEPDSAAPPSGWLAGQSPGDMLDRVLVREPAKSTIVAAGVTSEQIREEWANIKRAQLVGEPVKNAPALLVNRLCATLNIAPPSRGSPMRQAVNGVVDANLIARLARARENSASG